MHLDYLEGVVCQVCGNKESSKFKERFTKPDFKVVECTECSFQFIPNYFRKDTEYVEYKTEKDLEQVRRGNDWLKYQRHKLRFDLIKKFKKSGKLFDLGVGWGHFLETGRQLGYEISGIELAKNPYTYAKEDLKLPVEFIDFFEMKLNEKEFDIITMWDVLEHIDEADKVIERCKVMLKDDGILVIQVPQIDSYFAKRAKENWNMMGLDHVNYFSVKTLTQLLEKHGFEVKKVQSVFELKLFLMYILLPWLKKRKKLIEDPEDISSAERQEYYNKTANKPKWMLQLFVLGHNILFHIFSALKIGDEMTVVATKKR